MIVDLLSFRCFALQAPKRISTGPRISKKKQLLQVPFQLPHCQGQFFELGCPNCRDLEMQASREGKLE